MKNYGVKFSNKSCGRPISAFPASLCPLRLNVHARILTHQKLTQRTQRRSGLAEFTKLIGCLDLLVLVRDVISWIALFERNGRSTKSHELTRTRNGREDHPLFTASALRVVRKRLWLYPHIPAISRMTTTTSKGFDCQTKPGSFR